MRGPLPLPLRWTRDLETEAAGSHGGIFNVAPMKTHWLWMFSRSRAAMGLIQGLWTLLWILQRRLDIVKSCVDVLHTPPIGEG